MGTLRLTEERTLDVQSVTELHLPCELVEHPLFLANFLAGYLLYQEEDYHRALLFFEKGLKQAGSSPDELADLQFFTAVCHYALPIGSGQRAVELYEAASKTYAQRDMQRWAFVQSNLGAAYATFAPGDKVENTLRAISIFEDVLRVADQYKLVKLWSGTQINLGQSYAFLATTRDSVANWERSKQALERALSVIAEYESPDLWGAAQNGLSLAYLHHPAADPKENLTRAVLAAQAAAKTTQKKPGALDCAMYHHTLGTVTKAMSQYDPSFANLSVEAYETALHCTDEARSPHIRLLIYVALGSAYYLLPDGDRANNLAKAIAACEKAIELGPKADFPKDWARAHERLGFAYWKLPIGDRRKNLDKSAEAFRAALEVFTTEKYPKDAADTHLNLGQVLADPDHSDDVEKLREAERHLETSSRLYAVLFPGRGPGLSEMVLSEVQRRLRRK